MNDYNKIEFSIELLEWGRTFSDFWGKNVRHIYGSQTYQNVCTIKLKLNCFFTHEALKSSYVRAFQIEFEFGNVGFCREGKTGEPGEKPLGANERTNNKLNPHMVSTPGFEPGPHWWEASTLTTGPSLAPHYR